MYKIYAFGQTFAAPSVPEVMLLAADVVLANAASLRNQGYAVSVDFSFTVYMPSNISIIALKGGSNMKMTIEVHHV